MQDLLQDSSVWLAVSFAIFAWIVWSKGKNAVLAMIDNYAETVRKDIENAKALKIEAQALMNTYETKHRDAMKEAEEIIARARMQVEQIQAQAEKDLAEASARREKQLAERLERMKQTAISEIQNYAADLAIKATREIILEKLDGATQKKLVSAAINNVNENLN